MGRARLLDEGSRRHRDVPRHRHDLDLVVEFGRDDLDHLADRQALVVGGVEALPGRRRMIDREHHRMCEILDVAVGQQRRSAVRDDDVRTTIEHAAHDRPFSRRRLPWPVDHGVAVVRCLRVEIEDDVFGARDAVALAVDALVRAGRIFTCRHRHSRGVPEIGIHEAAIRGCAADRDELPRLAHHDLRDRA